MKAAFHTLGCKVNSYETQAVIEQFRGLSFDIVQFSEPADVYVVNTCSVTQMAEHKSRQMLHRAKKLNPEAVVVATGCYAQRDADTLLSDENIDIVVGNNKKSEIAQTVLEFLEERKKKAAVDDLLRCRSFEEQKISSLGENIRAYVKIQDGCDRFCSYCIIPYVRGRSRARAQEDVVREVEVLAANGYREVVLTGIDISDYDDLIGLIEKVNEVEGIERIRLGSLEEGIVTEEFIERFSKCKKACPHFHLSLQSGCEETLKRMNRHYTPEEYLRCVELIRKNFKDPGITTDIIVGFAGETDSEFEESFEFVKKAGFTQAHVFKYSRRKGTKADRMPDQVPEKIKTERSARLIELTSGLQEQFEDRLKGSRQQVLVEEKIRDDEGMEYLVGFTPEYVKIAAASEKDLVNRLVDVVPEKFITVRGEKILCGQIV